MLTLDDVRAVHERVEAVAQQTPLEYSHAFSEMTDAEVYLGLGNSQRTRSFGIHDVTNHITTLSDGEKAADVVAMSAGGHVQGVAFAMP